MSSQLIAEIQEKDLVPLTAGPTGGISHVEVATVQRTMYSLTAEFR